MYLSSVTIINNKSCKNLSLSFSEDKLETLIGINDSGKSTILRSIEAFFDEKKNLSFIQEDKQKSDFSNSPLTTEEFENIFKERSLPIFEGYNNDLIAILVEFKIEDADITQEFIDDAKNNHLKWSIEGTDRFYILRVFQKSTSENKLSGYYLVTKDLIHNSTPLEAWSKPKTELKKIRSELSISDQDVNNENGKGPFKNLEEVRAIYNNSKEPNILRWSSYKDFPKDKTFLPSFKYLNWEVNLKDLEDIANEAMQEVTEPLLKEVKNLAQAKQNDANAGVNTKFDELIEGLKDELPSGITKISSSVFFDVSKKITDIKLTKEGSDGEIHIDNQGDGIKRQIWFAILKWRSRLNTTETRNRHFWCFDEPETHLYPSAQRDFFNTLLTMCSNEFQILLSTHSTIFVDRANIQNVSKVNLLDGYSMISKAKTTDDIFDSLGIKNSDFLFYDKFLAVEGETEFSLVPSLYKLKNGKTLIEDGIQIINLKGASQKANNKRILESILTDFKNNTDCIYYLLDNDASAPANNTFLQGTYDLEDSIENEVWIEFIKNEYDLDVDSKTLDSEIRANLSNTQRTKFAPLLKSYLRTLNPSIELDKGIGLGDKLSTYITDTKYIPKSINDLFEAIAN